MGEVIHELNAGRPSLLVGHVGRRPARRVRAEVAVVDPARAALRSGVAGAAAIGRGIVDSILDLPRFGRAREGGLKVLTRQGLAAAREVGHHCITRHAATGRTSVHCAPLVVCGRRADVAVLSHRGSGQEREA